MEIVEQQEKKICPYLGIECQPICPGWIEPVEDCLFNVCMTEVKETFVEAARYLDEALGLASGTGHITLRNLRAGRVGESKNAAQDVEDALKLIMGSVAKKAANMPPEELAKTINKALDGIAFDFSDIFDED